MSQMFEILNTFDFEDEIGELFKIDSNNILDFVDKVNNILQKSEKLNFNNDRQIGLYKLSINENKKEEIYFIEILEDLEKEDDDTFIIFKNFNDAKKYFDDYINVKTMNEWKQSDKNDFSDFCKVDDKVSEDIINYFRDVMPPIIDRNNLLQVGEPYSHKLDKQDNKFKPTYITFEKEENFWVYKGDCFKDKLEENELDEEEAL